MNKKSVLVTGVSGVGKTALSKKLSEMGYTACDIEDFPGTKLFTMINKKTGKPVTDHDNADLEKVKDMDWVCDKQKLAEIIAKETSPLAFYCGIASNTEDLLPLFDLVILLKIDEPTTRHRLSTRTGNDFGNTVEVQDWIMTWKEWWENELEEKGVTIIDAHKSLGEVANEVIRVSTTD